MSTELFIYKKVLNDIEKMIMTKVNIEYGNQNENDMGFIARLVTTKKNEKVILICYTISIVFRHLLYNILFFIKIKKHYIQRKMNSSVENVKTKNVR